MYLWKPKNDDINQVKYVYQKPDDDQDEDQANKHLQTQDVNESSCSDMSIHICNVQLVVPNNNRLSYIDIDRQNINL